MRGPDPQRTSLARTLRRNQTSAEHRLWRAIRNRQVGGLKFVRQVPVGPYVADFLCREQQLIVEVDGATHSTAEELAHDVRREAYMGAAGYRVLRFHNSDVYDALDAVCEAILAAAAEPPRPSS